MVIETATVIPGWGVAVFGADVLFGTTVFGTVVDFTRLVFVGGFPAGLPLCCTSPAPDLACTGMERKLVRTSSPIRIVMGINENFDVDIA